MSWLAILQLAFALMGQALAAFAQGQKKEAHATVVLPPEHVATVKALEAQHK